MDRFKFRVWDKKNKNYVDLKFNNNHFYINHKGIVCPLGLNSYIIEQCTGLKDKNLKLIYEGDIIARNGMYRNVFWLYDEGGFGYEPSTLFEPLQTKDCEIVGNIHENKELLEVYDEEKS